MSTVASYFGLTKPRLLPLVLFSGLPALIMAGGAWPSPNVMIVVLLGTALAAGAANALNSYLERDRDSQMERTRSRPLPSGQIEPVHALIFGLTLSLLAVATLWISAGPVPAGIALAAIAFYVFIYTLWLKPRTPFAVVVGGVSGAICPLIADAAIGGSVGAAGWLLFAIIFMWQPPHFYAIALYRQSDYRQAGFPMLPDRIGAEATRRRILMWIAALIPLSLLPLAHGMLGPIYGVSALVLGCVFFGQAVVLHQRRDTASARRLFSVSLLYLMGLFGMMLIDLAWTAIA